MAKVLLVNYHQNRGLNPYHPESVSKVTGAFPPLGLLYLAAVLRQKGLADVEIYDANVKQDDDETFKNRIAASGADILGFTSSTFEWLTTVHAIKMAREALPEALIAVGGPAVGAYPKECLSFEEIDVGVIGEGEETLAEIVSRWDKGAPLDGIRGTVVHRDGHGVVAPPRPFIQNLDAIPFPARDLVDRKAYNAIFIRKPFATLITSRGCPFQCSFCSRFYFGTKVRTRSAENILAEFEECVERYGVREFMIYDDTFGVRKDIALELCDLIIERGHKFRWSARTRVDCVDAAALEKLRRAGCYKLHMGVESGSEEMLKRMKKGITLDQIRRTFRLAREAGIETVGYFMFGYPGDTLASMEKTKNLSLELRLSWADFSITTPAPRTELNDEFERSGYIDGDFWRRYTLGEPIDRLPYFTTPEFDEAALESILNEAFTKFYLRPSVILRKALSLQFWFEAKKSIDGALALLRMWRK
ncbi:MAG: B12-binding domain-containing radical SAM protein [Candidatus Coatesbacteria bacterium]|nr:B12-binding domain-containing radical SAM protein [Candidatus Coatesbacteria bacterium]